MIEDDVEVFKGRVLGYKLLFVLYFCGICVLFLAPVLLLMVFVFSFPGRISILFSLAIFTAVMIMIARLGERMIVMVTGASEVEPEQQHVLQSMAEDVCIATGRPFPALMVIDDHDSCNMFSIKRGKRAVIFFTRGMSERLDDEQLRTALAHEMAHIYQGDAAVHNLAISFMALTHRSWFSRPSGPSADRSFLLGVLATFLFGAALILSLILVEYFYVFLAGIIIPIYLVYGFSFSYPLFLPYIASNRDYEADELAAKLTLQPEELVSAIRESEACDRGDLLSFLQWMTFIPAAEMVGSRYRRLPGIEERIDNLERAFKLPEQP